MSNVLGKEIARDTHYETGVSHLTNRPAGSRSIHDRHFVVHKDAIVLNRFIAFLFFIAIFAGPLPEGEPESNSEAESEAEAEAEATTNKPENSASLVQAEMLTALISSLAYILLK